MPRGQPRHDSIFKIRSFVDRLRENFKNVFSPGDKVAVDKAMIAWRGPHALRVFNPYKPDKSGIKNIELCDSSTIYCCNLELYTGKQETSHHGATFDIINRLVSPYLGFGRTLYVDNFYTSPDLFTFLRENGTLACG